MEYKIDIHGLDEDYHFHTSGDVFFYMPKSVNKGFITPKKRVREVTGSHPGRNTSYLAIPLRYKDGTVDWVDAAELMARTAFEIPFNATGYVRHKNHDYTDLRLSNLEFVTKDPGHGRPSKITDTRGTIPYHMYVEKASSVNKESMAIPPGGHGKITPGKRTPSDFVKKDLGDRDRSKVAETLYILIEDRGYAVSNAVAVLMLEDSVDALRLYLEGRDSVYKTSEETIAKVNQERDKEFIKIGKLYNGKPMFLGASTGKSYIKVDTEYELI